jgi:Na+/citrate or Na+/malate symporter
MFSKQPKESSKSDNNELQKLVENTVENLTETENTEPETKTELVNLVEKISGIVSPYFIVLVGLILSDDNFFFGTILIIVGIISLLKITPKDISKLINWLTNFFSGDPDKI